VQRVLANERERKEFFNIEITIRLLFYARLTTYRIGGPRP